MTYTYYRNQQPLDPVFGQDHRDTREATAERRSFWQLLWNNISYDLYFMKLERGPIHPDDHGYEKCRVCSLEYRHHTCERGDKIITDHAFRRFNERLHGTAA